MLRRRVSPGDRNSFSRPGVRVVANSLHQRKALPMRRMTQTPAPPTNSILIVADIGKMTAGCGPRMELKINGLGEDLANFSWKLLVGREKLKIFDWAELEEISSA